MPNDMLTGEWWFGKFLEENGGSLKQTLIWHFTSGTDENSARTVHVPAEIRTGLLSNTILIGFIKHVYFYEGPPCPYLEYVMSQTAIPISVARWTIS
jgi:hypothetical protein